MKSPCVFDIEVLPNCFICCCKVFGQANRTFEISARKFELQEFYDFMTSDKYFFIGYNCKGYDTPIINMLFQKLPYFLESGYEAVAEAAMDLSKSIIVDRDMFIIYRYNNLDYFQDIDLMTMMASKALRVGLKSLQVTMCYPNVKEMMIKWSDNIEEDKIDEVITYCYNDIDSTAELFKLLKKDFTLRMNIQREFNIKCLSKDGVGIGVDIFTNFVCDKLRCHPKQLKNYMEVPDSIVVAKYIHPLIKFKTPQFQQVLQWYKNLELTVEDADEAFNDKTEELEEGVQETYKKTVVLNKLAHTFALGGVHSVNKPAVYTATDEWHLIDVDVESYYPSLALAFRFGPMGFIDAFLEVMQFLKDGRVIAKKNGDKLKNETYKLALNSILGNLKNKYSEYYGPQANVGICVNGQLMIAMLIEDCELEGIECISSNTDGATFRIHESKLELFRQLCDVWSKLTQMKLEETIYEKMVIYAVNDYIAFKKGYSEVRDKIEFIDPYTTIHNPEHASLELLGKYVKEKGMFITVPRLGKGLDALIIPKALQNYYGKGIPINKTIQDAISIWDFIKFQKIGKQYDVIWNEQEQQHINRFYVSKKGAYLYKRKFVEKYNKKSGRTENVQSLANVLKGYGVQIMNVFEDKPMTEYNIQYNYYIMQTNKIIGALEPIQQTLF
jgi:hypothetical protein